MIFGGRDRLSNFGPFRYLLFIAKIFVNVGNADSGTDTLDSDVTETRQQALKQTNLPLLCRREITVPTLGAFRHILSVIPGEKAFTHTRPARADRDAAAP